MAATGNELGELHGLIAKSLKARIEQDMKDDVPTDAATLSAAIKFLKDNNVSADPADADDLANLREALKEQADKRQNRRGTVLSLVQRDMAAEG